MAYPQDWPSAKQMLKSLFPDKAVCGRITARLLKMDVDRRLEYFEEEDDEVVRACLEELLSEGRAGLADDEATSFGRAAADAFAEKIGQRDQELVGALTEAVKTLLKPDRVSMSSAGSTLAGKVLKALGFGQIDGREVHSLPGIPSTFPAFAEFDMGKYFNEAEGTPAFVEYLQACLIKSKVAIGSDPGFAVRDLHSNDGRVSFTHESTVYTGIINAGVVPFGVMGDTSTSQLRVGLELKQTAEQKQRYQVNYPNEFKAKQRQAKKRKAEQASMGAVGAGGKLAYKGRSKGQAILELIGAYAGAEWPLSLYLTNGTVWHRLALYPKELVYWGDLTTREAMHCMASELKKAPTDRDFSLTDSRSARRLKPEQIKLMNDLRPLLGDNMLAEQIGSVMPFVDVEDRAATAMQLIQAHRPDEPPSLPLYCEDVHLSSPATRSSRQPLDFPARCSALKASDRQAYE